MPPFRGATRRWDAALYVAGEPVFTNAGGATLPQASYQALLGWVTAPSEGGNLTDLGMQAVKDGWWVDPPDQVLWQVRERQARAYGELVTINRRQKEQKMFFNLTVTPGRSASRA